ncbi:MAG: Methyl-accepting chemotaxis sensory transducer [uncultured bacterium]|nr:MAG: Methyl-accepting chemotaxis sensory transducer [uncultured bacterium]
MIHSSLRCLLIAAFLFLFLAPTMAVAEGDLTDFDRQVKKMAETCRAEIIHEFEILLSAKRLSIAQLFDTFYIPVPDTAPQKFATQYDKIVDQTIRAILDRYLVADSRLLFVVAIDKNGYVPSHNSRYSRPLTDDPDYNAKNNRAKRMFNDRTGLAAARNTAPYLRQKYSRDTGEELFDLSVPIDVEGRHWGAIRIGYTQQ